MQLVQLLSAFRNVNFDQKIHIYSKRCRVFKFEMCKTSLKNSLFVCVNEFVSVLVIIHNLITTHYMLLTKRVMFYTEAWVQKSQCGRMQSL